MDDHYSLDIDRLSMCQRPHQKSGGSQIWRNLVFMHWSIPLDSARALLPPNMELDLYQGQALVGVVPFEMYQVKPSWLPSIMSFNFLETNVRLYVLVDGRPGVYFLSLEAASWLAVQAARIGWGLPYFYAQMDTECMNLSHSPLTPDDFDRYSNQTITYSSVRRSPFSSTRSVGLNLKYRTGQKIGPSELGSLEFFLLERYLLFVSRKGTLYQGQVYHTPYPVYEAEIITLEQTLTHSHGLECSTPPLYVHASPGVDVDVFDLIPL